VDREFNGIWLADLFQLSPLQQVFHLTFGVAGFVAQPISDAVAYLALLAIGTKVLEPAVTVCHKLMAYYRDHPVFLRAAVSPSFAAPGLEAPRYTRFRGPFRPSSDPELRGQFPARRNQCEAIGAAHQFLGGVLKDILPHEFRACLLDHRVDRVRVVSSQPPQKFTGSGTVLLQRFFAQMFRELLE